MTSDTEKLIKLLTEAADCIRDTAEGRGGWAYEEVIDELLEEATKLKRRAEARS